jgi:hypothetical protein
MWRSITTDDVAGIPTKQRVKMHNKETEIEIDAQISIISTYDNKIIIEVRDASSSIKFLEMELTNEQFVNAALNRHARTPVARAVVNGLDRVGKIMRWQNFEFEIGESTSVEDIRNIALISVPEGWEPDLCFSEYGSIYMRGGVKYARTIIRKWV